MLLEEFIKDMPTKEKIEIMAKKYADEEYISYFKEIPNTFNILSIPLLDVIQEFNLQFKGINFVSNVAEIYLGKGIYFEWSELSQTNPDSRRYKNLLKKLEQKINLYLEQKYPAPNDLIRLFSSTTDYEYTFFVEIRKRNGLNLLAIEFG